MAFDVLSDIKPLILAAISGLATTAVAGEFTADTSNCIAIAHTGGYDPEHTFSGGNASLQKAAIVRPTFQIAMRHESEHTMHSWWDYIKAALDGKVNYTPTGETRTYIIIEQQGDVLDGGRDNNRRHIQYLNFTTMVINAY